MNARLLPGYGDAPLPRLSRPDTAQILEDADGLDEATDELQRALESLRSAQLRYATAAMHSIRRHAIAKVDEAHDALCELVDSVRDQLEDA